MFQVAQFDTGLPREFGVQMKYLDREGDLVDYALARTVTAGEQFKIVQRVVLAIAVAMMNGFLFVKFAAEMLSHYVAMFHDESSRSSSAQLWNDNPNVTISFDMFSVFTGFKSLSSPRHLIRYFAFLAAIFLIAVYFSTRVTASVFSFSTLFARKGVSRICVFSNACVGAGHRAVKWIAVEFFSVGSHVGLHHRKRFPAFFAGEIDRRSTCSRQAFLVQVRGSANKAAVFATFFSFVWVAVERLRTVRARHLDRHSCAPLVWRLWQYGCVDRGCQVNAEIGG